MEIKQKNFGRRTKYLTSSNLAELSALSTNNPKYKKLYPSFRSKELMEPLKRLTCSIVHSVRLGKSEVINLLFFNLTIS